VIDLPCSSLTLEQSFQKVFEIIASAKLPSIERQHLNSLQSHISFLLASEKNDQNKRILKSARKSIRRVVQTTIQKVNEDENEDLLEVTPFDLPKTPGKRGGQLSQVMTRSQIKRKRKTGASAHKRRRID